MSDIDKVTIKYKDGWTMTCYGDPWEGRRRPGFTRWLLGDKYRPGLIMRQRFRYYDLRNWWRHGPSGFIRIDGMHNNPIRRRFQRIMGKKPKDVSWAKSVESPD